MSAYIQTVVGSDSPPVGAVMDFAGNVEPSGWLFCFGQAIARTGMYAQLFQVIGTLYGSGDGSNTFNLPDFRGRVGAGKDDMGGTAANRLQTAWGVNGAVLGANGGSQSHQLTEAQMPNHNHQYSQLGGSGGSAYSTGGQAYGSQNTSSRGSDAAHPNVQPTFIVNKIIKYTVSGVVLPIVPGDGDVVGPDGGVIDGDLAVFNGTSGKIIKKGAASGSITIGGVTFRSSGMLLAHATAVASTGGVEQTIWTFNLPANFLGRDGDSLRLAWIYNFGGTSSARRAKIYLNSVMAWEYNQGASTTAMAHHTITTITRVSQTSQQWMHNRSMDNGNASAEYFSTVHDLGIAMPIAIAVLAAGAAIITHRQSTLEFLPAP